MHPQLSRERAIAGNIGSTITGHGRVIVHAVEVVGIRHPAGGKAEAVVGLGIAAGQHLGEGLIARPPQRYARQKAHTARRAHSNFHKIGRLLKCIVGREAQYIDTIGAESRRSRGLVACGECRGAWTAHLDPLRAHSRASGQAVVLNLPGQGHRIGRRRDRTIRTGVDHRSHIAIGRRLAGRTCVIDILDFGSGKRAAIEADLVELAFKIDRCSGCNYRNCSEIERASGLRGDRGQRLGELHLAVDVNTRLPQGLVISNGNMRPLAGG